MKISLRRVDNAFQMEARNESDNTVSSDGSAAVGWHDLGMRFMEMFISALRACSSIDVISFLQKMRQPLKDIKVDIDAKRDPDSVPSLFTHVHIMYTLRGNLDKKKVEKAISLSVDQYCSVARILEKTSTITWACTIVPA